MIYLIGVWHNVQFWNESDYRYKQRDINNFSLHLKNMVRKYDVIMIGEEFNKEAMEKNNATHCTTQDVATNLGIMHKWCDPDSRERQNCRGDLMRFREEYWFKQISDLADKAIIFICGSNHLESFRKVIETAGFKTKILSRDWGSDLERKKALNIED
jgi:hypothetical protein